MAAYREKDAHSAYDMFSKYKYLIVNLVFTTSVFFLSGNFFLIAPSPDHCLLVLFPNKHLAYKYSFFIVILLSFCAEAA